MVEVITHRCHLLHFVTSKYSYMYSLTSIQWLFWIDILRQNDTLQRSPCLLTEG